MSDTSDFDKARDVARRWSGAVDSTLLARLILKQRAEQVERCAMEIGEFKLDPHTPDTQKLAIQLEAICRSMAADLRRQAGNQ